jgi:hypothetical protein
MKLDRFLAFTRFLASLFLHLISYFLLLVVGY